MQLLSLAGGVSTAFLKDETHISPLFKFDNIVAANLFVQWVDTHFDPIKKEAEQTTKHGRLERLEPHLFDRNVALKFCYSTGDAMGSNMITLATEAACQYIASVIKPVGYHIQSSFSAMKKVTAHNFLSGYGRSVVAEALIPADLIQRFYGTTPQTILSYYLKAVKSTLHAGMMGFTGHAANAITAIFIACGQDVANVVESHMGVSSCEVTPEGGFYISLKLPNLILGTAGGGSGLATQKECLDLLGCVGRGTSKKFAEIVCAAVLAGEVAMYASNAGGTFVDSFRGVRHRQNE
jgi:hydroxymethylglutaryl-CoA reductase (NADPH)